MLEHGNSEPSAHRFFDGFGALRSSVQHVIDRVTTSTSPARMRAVAARTRSTIEAHPFASAAIAIGFVGLGIVAYRLARRDR